MRCKSNSWSIPIIRYEVLALKSCYLTVPNWIFMKIWKLNISLGHSESEAMLGLELLVGPRWREFHCLRRRGPAGGRGRRGAGMKFTSALLLLLCFIVNVLYEANCMCVWMFICKEEGIALRYACSSFFFCASFVCINFYCIFEVFLGHCFWFLCILLRLHCVFMRLLYLQI